MCCRRMGGKGEAHLFVICPQKRDQQCKGKYVRAERFLDPYTLYASKCVLKIIVLLLPYCTVGPHISKH